MPGKDIQRPGRKVPAKKKAENKTVNSSASRPLKNTGRKTRIHGGYDKGRVA